MSTDYDLQARRDCPDCRVKDQCVGLIEVIPCTDHDSSTTTSEVLDGCEEELEDGGSNTEQATLMTDGGQSTAVTVQISSSTSTKELHPHWQCDWLLSLASSPFGYRRAGYKAPHSTQTAATSSTVGISSIPAILHNHIHIDSIIGDLQTLYRSLQLDTDPDDDDREIRADGGHSADGTARWERAGCPTPTSAVRVDSGECAFGCGRGADYLVKVENESGATAKTRVCEPCNDENRIWAERHLPPEADRHE